MTKAKSTWRQARSECGREHHAGLPLGTGRGLLRSLTLKTEGNGKLCRTRVTLLVESRVWVWVPRAGDTCGPRQMEADPSC